jgi:hypothetical protein
MKVGEKMSKHLLHQGDEESALLYLSGLHQGISIGQSLSD